MERDFIGIYTAIWVVLTVLTLVEMMLVIIHAPFIILLLGVLGLAGIKAILVALFYQHLKYDDVAISWFYLIALFFILFIVMVWTGGSSVCQV